MKNPYKVLGVENNSTLSECKKAYRMLCSKHHPDNVNGDRDKFDEIQKAWELIKSGNYISLSLPKSRSLSHSSLFKFTVVLDN